MASVVKLREVVVEMTVVIIAEETTVVVVAVMISREAVVEIIVLIRKSVTVRIIKNHALLQAKRKQALLFVTRAINNKKRFKMNRFFI